MEGIRGAPITEDTVDITPPRVTAGHAERLAMVGPVERRATVAGDMPRAEAGAIPSAVVAAGIPAEGAVVTPVVAAEGTPVAADITNAFSHAPHDFKTL